MRQIEVVLSYVGNVYRAQFFVPQDEDLRRFKNILETQPRVLSMTELVETQPGVIEKVSRT